MGTQQVRKGTAKYKELTEGLPSSFHVTIDWDSAQEKCDLDRRNCAIYHALAGRRDVTRISVGADEINFIWKGDARIAIKPSAQAMGVIARNDLAAQGELPWPTGKQKITLDLSGAVVKRDLRVGRAVARKRREEKPDAVADSLKRSRDLVKSLDYKERARKRLETERLRGRFV